MSVHADLHIKNPHKHRDFSFPHSHGFLTNRAGGGTRTHTPSRTADFESASSAIPTRRHSISAGRILHLPADYHLFFQKPCRFSSADRLPCHTCHITRYHANRLHRKYCRSARSALCIGHKSHVAGSLDGAGPRDVERKRLCDS